MKVELNDRYLRSLKPPEIGRLEISDTKRKGLRLRLSARGNAVWMYEKRVKGGLKRKHTFGAWPAVSLADARSVALEIEVEAAKGIDRVAILEARKLEDEAAKAGLSTVQQVINTYDELHLANLRTGVERKRQLEQSLSKHLHKSIADLTRKDLQEAVDAKAKEGRKIFANRIRAALVAFANWAWVRGYLQEHIGAGVAKPSKEVSRDRVLTLQEVQTIYQTSHELGPLWGPLVRLLLLTGQRRGEIVKLRWDEIDLAKARIVKAGSTTKNKKPHTTHLSHPALTEIEGMTGERVGYVFTTTGTTPVSGISKVKERFDKALGNDFEPWRFHDIRTGMATALAEAGEPETIVDRILNHAASGSAPSAVARVYNQAEQLPLRARALDRWAAMVTGERSTVIKMEVR